MALFHAHQLVWLSEGHARYDAITTVDNFQKAWTEEIFPHFKNEESILPPLPVSTESIERLRADHRLIIDLVVELGKDDKRHDIELCRKVGQTLIDHIRWEEHVLFPEVEQSLTTPELDVLQETTKAIDVARKHSV